MELQNLRQTPKGHLLLLLTSLQDSCQHPVIYTGEDQPQQLGSSPSTSVPLPRKFFLPCPDPKPVCLPFPVFHSGSTPTKVVDRRTHILWSLLDQLQFLDIFVKCRSWSWIKYSFSLSAYVLQVNNIIIKTTYNYRNLWQHRKVKR